MAKKLILASGSPRRSELLTQIGIPFTVLSSDCEETCKETEPAKLVEALALQKAQDVWNKLQDGALGEDFSKPEAYLVLGADTMVAKDGHVFGKPGDEAEAFSMLHALQGTSHQVFSGVALITAEETICFHVRTEVEVYPMTNEQIHAYIATGEPMDKAGAYAIQGRFAEYIREIHGDYYNVVGLPVARVMKEIRKFI
ncbi:MAG: Maf family protein [Clostridiaceae bacterium]|nr:Maf family protein [Clostridiaceae bacterium]